MRKNQGNNRLITTLEELGITRQQHEQWSGTGEGWFHSLRRDHGVYEFQIQEKGLKKISLIELTKNICLFVGLPSAIIVLFKYISYLF